MKNISWQKIFLLKKIYDKMETIFKMEMPNITTETKEEAANPKQQLLHLVQELPLRVILSKKD